MQFQWRRLAISSVCIFFRLPFDRFMLPTQSIRQNRIYAVAVGTERAIKKHQNTEINVTNEGTTELFLKFYWF